MTTIQKKLHAFVDAVLSMSDLDYNSFNTNDLNDFDGRRIFISLDNEKIFSYFIRTWNISENGIRFTLFKEIDNTCKEVFNGYYPFPYKYD